MSQQQWWETVGCQPQPSPIDRRVWICPYCGKEHQSEHEGTDVACCGERGHAVVMNGPDDPWADDDGDDDEAKS